MSSFTADSKYHLGLYLGVSPSAGGMFQYAQSLLEALLSLDQRYVITIAYLDEDWRPVLERFGVTGNALKYTRIGQFMADTIMVLGLSGPIAKVMGRIFNPIVRQLIGMKCSAWIFPAQDSLSYQVPTQSVGTIHDLMHRYESSFPEVSSRFRYFIREHRFKNIANYCDLILVDSNVGLQHVVESYGVAKEKIYPLPYIAPSYIKVDLERDNFEEFYALPKNFLFYPAQFWPHKNHKRLVDALQIAIKIHPDINLVLSGGLRHQFENIRGYVDSLGLAGHVHFVGYVPDQDLRGFYIRARALVMPTFFGPTNIPPLEALASGCPVIISGIYGIEEQLKDAALYFNPLNIADIAQKIVMVWGDNALANDLCSKGLARSSKYGQGDFNELVEEALKKLH
jgi:glycosyltransferase involved in cell wall biosynthesis